VFAPEEIRRRRQRCGRPWLGAGKAGVTQSDGCGDGTIVANGRGGSASNEGSAYICDSVRFLGPMRHEPALSWAPNADRRCCEMSDMVGIDTNMRL